MTQTVDIKYSLETLVNAIQGLYGICFNKVHIDPLDVTYCDIRGACWLFGRPYLITVDPSELRYPCDVYVVPLSDLPPNLLRQVQNRGVPLSDIDKAQG